MKIIIPYVASEWFFKQDHQLMENLGMTDASIIDQALTHWTRYVHGSAQDAYELTVDNAYEYLFSKFGDTDECVLAQQCLANNADELTELIRATAIRLHQLLQDIPDEISRRYLETDEYTYLKVESINTAGRFAVLTSEVIDPA